MRMKYKFPDFAYIAVPEFQKDIDFYGVKKPHGGHIHYHLLCKLKRTPVMQLNKIWSGGGVEIERIDRIKKVGNYLAKYLTKNLEDIRFKNKKKYFTSTNLNKPIIFTDILAHWYMHTNEARLMLEYEGQYRNEYNGEVLHQHYLLT